MKKIILILSSLKFLFACVNSDKTSEPEKDTSYFDPNFVYVQLIPDSLRTNEDNELIEKLRGLYKYLKVKNNEVFFDLNKEEFGAMGIPEQYYDLIQKDVVNMNKMFQENNVTNVDSVFRESYKQQLFE